MKSISQIVDPEAIYRVAVQQLMQDKGRNMTYYESLWAGVPNDRLQHYRGSLARPSATQPPTRYLAVKGVNF